MNANSLKQRHIRSMKRMKGRVRTPPVTAKSKNSFIRSYIHTSLDFPLFPRGGCRSIYETALLSRHTCGQRHSPPLNGGFAGEIAATVALPHIATLNQMEGSAQ